MPFETPEAVQEAIKQYSSTPFPILLTLSHPQISKTYRLARNHIDIVSRGEVYEATQFNIVMPTDSEEASQCQVRIANISRKITRTIQKLHSSPVTVIEVILASAPDIVQLSFSVFQYSDISWNAFTITGNLTKTKFWDEPYPKESITPYSFPGMFAI